MRILSAVIENNLVFVSLSDIGVACMSPKITTYAGTN